MTEHQYWAGVSAPVQTAAEAALTAAAFTGVGVPGDPNKIRLVNLADLKHEALHPLGVFKHRPAPGQSTEAFAVSHVGMAVRLGFMIGLLILFLFLIG